MKVSVEEELEQLKTTLDKEFDSDNIIVTEQLIKQTLHHITEQNPETPIQKQNKRKAVRVWKIVNIAAACFILLLAAAIWKNSRIFNKEKSFDRTAFDLGTINSEAEEEKQIVEYSKQLEEGTETKGEKDMLQEDVAEAKQEMSGNIEELERVPIAEKEQENSDDWSRKSSAILFSFQNYKITENDVKEISVFTQTLQDTITDHKKIQAYLDYMEQSSLTLQEDREEKQKKEKYILQLQLKNKASDLILTLQFYETELCITYYKTETVEYYTGTEYKQLLEQLINLS